MCRSYSFMNNSLIIKKLITLRTCLVCVKTFDLIRKIIILYIVDKFLLHVEIGVDIVKIATF